MPTLDRDTNARAVYPVDGTGAPAPAGTASAPMYVITSSGAALPAGTSRSGTITTGGTSQQLAAANAARTFLKGQNLSTGDLWINEVGGAAAAVQPSYRIPAGSTFGANTNQAIAIWGATTGQAFSVTEG